MTTVKEAIEFAKTHPVRVRRYMSDNPTDPLVVFLTNPGNKLTEEFVGRIGLYYLRDGVEDLIKTVLLLRKVTKQALRTNKYAKNSSIRKLYLRDYVSYYILYKTLRCS